MNQITELMKIAVPNTIEMYSMTAVFSFAICEPIETLSYLMRLIIMLHFEENNKSLHFNCSTFEDNTEIKR